jgi:hypothetical protein
MMQVMMQATMLVQMMMQVTGNGGVCDTYLKHHNQTNVNISNQLQ